MQDRIFELLRSNNGIIRTADAESVGISRTTLSTFAKKGVLERIAQGQYILAGDLPDELFALQQRSDKIIFSHETALYLHDMAERTPLLHSLTIPSNTKLSPTLSRGCKLYYVKPELHSLGMCSMKSKMGNIVFTYDVERTICDVIRNRSRIDSQTFSAALRNYANQSRHDWSKLREYSEAFRIANLLFKYLEVLI